MADERGFVAFVVCTIMILLPSKMSRSFVGHSLVLCAEIVPETSFGRTDVIRSCNLTCYSMQRMMQKFNRT